MKRRPLRLWWMDDEPDRLKNSAIDAIEQPDQLRGRRSKLRVEKLGGDKGIVTILDELDAETKKGNGPDLIVIDQMLQLTQNEEQIYLQSCYSNLGIKSSFFQNRV